MEPTKIDRPLTKDSILLSMRLHDLLIKLCLMDAPMRGFTAAQNRLLPEVVFADMQEPGTGTIETIPFFPRLFMNSGGRKCAMCGKAKGQLYIPNTNHNARWAEVKALFPGDWSWQIAAFPTSEVLPACTHDFDICRACIRSFISAEMESRGLNAVLDITCPSATCTHKLTWAEFRRLASPDVSARVRVLEPPPPPRGSEAVSPLSGPAPRAG
ncbi:hypothetical protein ONZ43_g6870 [Nemania bipapillata]|uniref:Uncharacterized protein n=1 Tax=Nemania bipapillata TaxID=110536 RepID=A0ACC2HWW3_9PEZI|nr:hypothetical protein ONZ43_g6870 [Nemania bipapillata]